jgi:peptidoglycan-N-acetylglucosamine deacetylase
LVARLRKDPAADLSGFKQFYLEHLSERATYYDSLAQLVTSRRINHVLLLHHNLAAALFLDDLIAHFKAQGWDVMDADKAYQDAIYRHKPENLPAGESIVWALAWQRPEWRVALRYPAEDGTYEKARMDKLGL